MLTDTAGIHHVTGIVGDPQQNVDCYAGTLGLRLVKRTVNYEDMLRYHLYYGNGTADVGTLVTCFPYPNDAPGRVGRPQWSAVGFAIPRDAVEYWRNRLTDAGFDVEAARRFDERVLQFADPAGTRVELVTSEQSVDPWADGPVPADVAVRGVHGVTALPTNPYATASTLETLGFDHVAEEATAEGRRVRYRAPGDHAATVDVLDHEAAYGREGTGTIQHVAVRAASEDELYEWHDLFRERDYAVSRVRDRNYFHSLYVRDPGGILFELATEEPGLTADESVAALGESLVLPSWFEADRDLIESQLPPITDPTA